MAAAGGSWKGSSFVPKGSGVSVSLLKAGDTLMTGSSRYGSQYTVTKVNQKTIKARNSWGQNATIPKTLLVSDKYKLLRRNQLVDLSD
jgi:hypothetical protein